MHEFMSMKLLNWVKERAKITYINRSLCSDALKLRILTHFSAKVGTAPFGKDKAVSAPPSLPHPAHQ